MGVKLCPFPIPAEKKLFHSISEKRFLTAVISASATADPDGDLRTALDTIASHPNVGPFISRQLIQRLVTSNPTPAYVARVAQAFGAGDRKITRLNSSHGYI